MELLESHVTALQADIRGAIHAAINGMLAGQSDARSGTCLCSAHRLLTAAVTAARAMLWTQTDRMLEQLHRQCSKAAFVERVLRKGRDAATHAPFAEAFAQV